MVCPFLGYGCVAFVIRWKAIIGCVLILEAPMN